MMRWNVIIMFALAVFVAVVGMVVALLADFASSELVLGLTAGIVGMAGAAIKDIVNPEPEQKDHMSLLIEALIGDDAKDA